MRKTKKAEFDHAESVVDPAVRAVMLTVPQNHSYDRRSNCKIRARCLPPGATPCKGPEFGTLRAPTGAELVYRF